MNGIDKALRDEKKGLIVAGIITFTLFAVFIEKGDAFIAGFMCAGLIALQVVGISMMKKMKRDIEDMESSFREGR